MAVSVMLDLVGGVSLLLWGLHMVHSGVVRAFGARIKRVLGSVLKNRLESFLAGLGVTTLLQSSTATALMLSSFSASGIVDLGPAMAIMLGANVGTTLIVQFLTFNSSAVSPILLLCGVIAFQRGQRTITRDLGRVAIGLGLMLLSLHMLLETMAPAEHAPIVRVLLGAITGDVLLNLFLGAILAWAAHSSVATVLVVISLAYSNFITLPAALALVLGANLGSALNPLLEGVSGKNPAHRRLPVANLLNRVVGCLIFLPFLEPAAHMLTAIEPSSVRAVADFHTGFNLVMTLVSFPVLNWLARIFERALPDRKSTQDISVPLYLDESVIEVPAVGLTCAARETLHMGDIVETMLRQGMTALMKDDRKLVSEVSHLDNAVDKLHEAIKLYVIKLMQGSLDEAEGARAMEIMTLSINLEHIGDIIDKNLMELATKKIKRQSGFSREGAMELEEFHRIISEHLKLAFSIFLTGDVKLARQLLEEKTRIRELEMAAAEHHLERLKSGRIESLETSSLHLDVLRDLKRIHSHICATAYPVLEAAGELRPNRLKVPSSG